MFRLERDLAASEQDQVNAARTGPSAKDFCPYCRTRARAVLLQAREDFTRLGRPGELAEIETLLKRLR